MEPQDYTLLVVDDNEMNRDMLSRRLKRRGYGVLVAEDGQQALDLVAEEPVDLVLLDIMMPGIDGLEVLRVLRQDRSQAELPVIMATAKADSEDVVEALDLGANDYVIKPLDFPVVLARVQTQLRSKAPAPAPTSDPPKEPTIGELEPGAVVVGKYRLEEKIGAGNFGAVYRARHLDLDHDVAFKVLQPSVTASEESKKRFRQEGVAACRVKHPNAVLVSDYGVSETGVAYLVMELLQGVSLSAELRAAAGQRLSPARCFEILGPVCDVLAEAHDAGLVHRDIKPENVFLHRTSRGEQVKVLDFGIAKLTGETISQENLTAEGWIVGTPAYMAPERLQNQAYDGRADVYSLGIVLFEMLSGKRPFPTTSDDPMAMLMMHLKEEPARLRQVVPSLSVELEDLVAQTMRKDPATRPDARALKASFQTVLAGNTPGRERSSKPIGPPSPTDSGSDSPGSVIDVEAPTIAIQTDPRPKPAPSEPAGGLFRRWLRRLTRRG